MTFSFLFVPIVPTENMDKQKRHTRHVQGSRENKQTDKQNTGINVSKWRSIVACIL